MRGFGRDQERSNGFLESRFYFYIDSVNFFIVP